MHLRLNLLILFSLGLCALVSAHQSHHAHPEPLTLLNSFPKCAQSCVLGAFVGGICAHDDHNCVCHDEKFLAGLSTCVTNHCTVPDSLVAQNISETHCENPRRDRGPKFIKLEYTMIVMAGIFVFARFAFKIVEGLPLGLDDWTILVTMVLSIGATGGIIGGTIKHGLGKDMWTLEPHDITQLLLYFYAVAALYFATITMLKLSIIFFYMKVFPTRATQRLLRGTAVFTALWGLAYTIIAIFQCRPIGHFWKRWTGLHPGTCLDMNAFALSNAGISIMLDLWSLGIPMWEIQRLQMHWKQKISVALMFGVGTFVTVVSIVRLQAIEQFGKSKNLSWDYYNVSFWSALEVGVGLVCACLPTIRLMLVKLIPSLGDFATRSAMQQQIYGSDSRSQQRDKAAKTLRSGLEANSQGSEGVIVKKTSYTVEHRNGGPDEIGLVERGFSIRAGR